MADRCRHGLVHSEGTEERAIPCPPFCKGRQVEEILSDALTPTGIGQWWAGQWECSCSEPHGTRAEFLVLNPDAVIEAAHVWLDSLDAYT